MTGRPWAPLHHNSKRVKGLEPSTSTLARLRSTTELHPQTMHPINSRCRARDHNTFNGTGKAPCEYNTAVRNTTLIVALALSCSASADISLPSVFSDHMVLQRDMPVAVWGSAAANQPVRVEAIDAKGTCVVGATATADPAGRFSVRLASMTATSDPLVLRVTCAGESIERRDVLVGEVWLCGGQSNMEWAVGGSDGRDALAQSLPSTVRCFRAPHEMAAHPQGDQLAQWAVADPQTTMGFTAIGSFFAAKVGSSLGVPIGILSINWGGSPAEPWTPADLAQKHPMFAATVAQQQSAGAAFEAQAPAQLEGTQSSSPPATAPAAPTHPLAQWTSFGSMWNAMMAPVVPYSIRGALWYQGESNADRAAQYRELLPLMIQSWRAKWGEGDFPFGIVQLAGFRAASDNPVEGVWSDLRDAQLNTAQVVPNCGMAVAIDVGDADDIHPRNKAAVADRLAAWALSQVYGKGGEWCGPLYRSSEVRGSTVVLSFDHAEGLAGARGASVGGFAIAGNDGKFCWGDAKMEGSTLVVSSSQVAAPVAVRYAWSSNPTRANLVNAAGFPASPFATDRPKTMPVR